MLNQRDKSSEDAVAADSPEPQETSDSGNDALHHQPVLTSQRRIDRWLLGGALLALVVVGIYVFWKQHSDLSTLTNRVDTLAALVMPSPSDSTNSADTSTTPVARPTATVDMRLTCVATVPDDFPLQARPGGSDETLETLPADYQLWVTGRLKNGQWFRVLVRGEVDGWLPTSALVIEKNCYDNIPILPQP